MKVLHFTGWVHTLNDMVKKCWQQPPVQISNFSFSHNRLNIIIHYTFFSTLDFLSWVLLQYSEKLQARGIAENQREILGIYLLVSSATPLKESLLQIPSSPHTTGRKILGLDKSLLCPVTITAVIFLFFLFEKSGNLCISETAHIMILSYYHLFFAQICSCICTQTAH